MSERDPKEPAPLDPVSRTAAASVLAAAFTNDPLYAYLHPEPGPRSRWLSGYMARVLPLLAPDGRGVQVHSEGGRVVGAFVLLGPGRYPPPAARKLGFAARVLAVSPRPPLRRVGNVVRLLGSVDAAHPAYLHHYLPLVGVSPDAQGRGVGRLLLERIGEVGAADGLPIYLETANELNVAYYERFGFGVKHEVHPIADAPVIYGMERRPGGG